MTLLTIAGFDPSSGAGITADLAVFAAHGYFGVSAITALTVQSTLGVRSTEPMAAELVRETLDCLVQDIEIAGVKIGMLATRSNVEVVAAFLARLPDVPIVLDPVLRSSSGQDLLEAEGLPALRERLLPHVHWATPNRQEFMSLGEMPEGVNLVVTGGEEDASDRIVAGGVETWLRGERIESRATHGTGCAFSSALLCGLVAGLDGIAAAREAKEYVRQAILRAPAVGHGRGPMALGWPTARQRNAD